MAVEMREQYVEAMLAFNKVLLHLDWRLPIYSQSLLDVSSAWPAAR
jgi:hypothetical protein